MAEIRCKLCEREIEDGETVDLGEERVICKSCMREITKRGLKEIISEMEFGVVDTILEKLL